MRNFSEQEAHCEYSHLAMKDGTRLAYVVWRPKEDRRYPTILNYSAYAESGRPFSEAKRLLDAGYAYVGMNVRGTGASEGAFSYFQPIEARDGAEVVEWVAAQPWSTGNVGMVGGSYGGHTQIAVAALRPPHLKAIVPLSVDGSEYRDEAMTGGLFNAALMADWAFRIQPELGRIGAEARVRGGDAECAAIRAYQPPNPTYYEALRHPLNDEWWKERSLDTVVQRVTVPTLIIQAWQDEFIAPNGAIRLFKLLRSPHKKLLLQNGPHRLGPYRFNQKEQMRWLDRWVKGERNGVETEPPVTVLWEVIEPEDTTCAAPSWTTTYPTWPVPTLQWTTFYLTAAGGLSPERPGAVENHGARNYVYPLGTELVGNNEQFRISPFPLGALNYQTSPMTSDTALLGAPQLTFFFSTQQNDTDFMFTLKDIDPAGNTLFLQRSVLRASLRAVDKDLSSPDEIVQAFAEREMLEPGRIYEIKLSLSALGHVIREGHRLELSILAPSPIPNPVWGFASVFQSSVNTIYHSNSYASKLQLPVVPGQKAPKLAPTLGALRNQPYRPALTAEGGSEQ